MKTSTSLLRRIAVAIALSTTAFTAVQAQTTATTVPVGFMTATINGHDNGTGLDGNTAISVPLYAAADFVGAVTQLNSTTAFSFTVGTTLPTFDAAIPRLARVKASATAAHVGKFFLITANSATQVTVSLPSGVLDVANQVSVGDSVEVLPANTIGSVFGNPTTLFGNTTATTADNILLQSGAGWATYYWKTNVTPNRWVQNAAGNGDKASTVIFPDDGVYVLRRAVGNISLTFSGTVPSTGEQSDVVAPNTFLANRFPTDTTLGALGLENLPNWVKNTTAATSDNVYIVTPGGSWARYYFKTNATPSAHWVLNAGGNTDRASVAIPAGTAIYISYANSTTNTLSQVLPYTP